MRTRCHKDFRCVSFVEGKKKKKSATYHRRGRKARTILCSSVCRRAARNWARSRVVRVYAGRYVSEPSLRVDVYADRRMQKSPQYGPYPFPRRACLRAYLPFCLSCLFFSARARTTFGVIADRFGHSSHDGGGRRGRGGGLERFTSNRNEFLLVITFRPKPSPCLAPDSRTSGAGVRTRSSPPYKTRTADRLWATATNRQIKSIPSSLVLGFSPFPSGWIEVGASTTRAAHSAHLSRFSRSRRPLDGTAR